MVKLPDNMSLFSQSPRRRRKGRALFKILMYPVYWMYSIKLWTLNPWFFIFALLFPHTNSHPSKKKVYAFFDITRSELCVYIIQHIFSTNKSTKPTLKRRELKSQCKQKHWIFAHSQKELHKAFTSSMLISGAAHDATWSGRIDLKVLGYHCVQQEDGRFV